MGGERNLWDGEGKCVRERMGDEEYRIQKARFSISSSEMACPKNLYGFNICGFFSFLPFVYKRPFLLHRLFSLRRPIRTTSADARPKTAHPRSGSNVTRTVT